MSKALIVVGLGGSLAENSKSRAALEVALDGAADAGAETQLLDLRRLDLPLYNPEDDEPTETAATLIEAAYAERSSLEQPALPGDDLRRVQERARLAAHARRS
jgi:multimeric flavodoxin WrbA